ncbi:MAG: hypothetical protein KBT03_12990 [Bacteroidales bacterium]|nr:hypothetical protein [Candidatus Scybalousia scybalohippi]
MSIQSAINQTLALGAAGTYLIDKGVSTQLDITKQQFEEKKAEQERKIQNYNAKREEALQGVEELGPEATEYYADQLAAITGDRDYSYDKQMEAKGIAGKLKLNKYIQNASVGIDNPITASDEELADVKGQIQNELMQKRNLAEQSLKNKEMEKRWKQMGGVL